MKKRCIKCHQEKELNELNFSRKKSNKTGFDNRCKDCRKEIDRQRYEVKRNKILQQKKQYYQRKKARIMKRDRTE